MTFFKKKKKSDQSTDASKKDFAEFWGGIMPTIRTVKNAGHCFSAVTEYLVLQKIVGAEFSGLYKFWAILLSILITISIIAIIEMGISRFAPFVFRFLFRKKWNTGWNWLMFIPILAVVIPLTFFSTTLSRDGGFEIVDSAKSEVAMTNLNKADDDYEQQKDKAQASFDDKRASINQSFDNKVSANKSDFAAQIGIQQQKIKKNKRLVSNGHAWAQGHIDKAYADIAKLKAKRDNKESQIETERTNALLTASETFDANVLKIENRAEKHLSQIEKSDNEKAKKRDKFVSIWGGLLGSFALFSVLGVLFCIALIEIYRAGSGQEYEKAIDNGKQSRFERFGSAIGKKIGGFSDWIIEGIEKDWRKKENASPTLAEDNIEENNIYLTENNNPIQINTSTALASNELQNYASTEVPNYSKNEIGFKTSQNNKPPQKRDSSTLTRKDIDSQIDTIVGERLKTVNETWKTQFQNYQKEMVQTLQKQLTIKDEHYQKVLNQLVAKNKSHVEIANENFNQLKSKLRQANETIEQLSNKNGDKFTKLEAEIKELRQQLEAVSNEPTVTNTETVTTHRVETVKEFDATDTKRTLKKYLTGSDRLPKSWTQARQDKVEECASALVHNGYHIALDWNKKDIDVSRKPIYKVGEKTAVVTIEHDTKTVQSVTILIQNSIK